MGTQTLIIPHLGVRTLRFLLETITTKGKLMLRICCTNIILNVIQCSFHHIGPKNRVKFLITGRGSKHLSKYFTRNI